MGFVFVSSQRQHPTMESLIFIRYWVSKGGKAMNLPMVLVVLEAKCGLERGDGRKQSSGTLHGFMQVLAKTLFRMLSRA